MPALLASRSVMPVVRQPAEDRLQWRSSLSLHDERWDDFLEREPLGQFQQTSCWAEAKAADGWSAIREVIVTGERIVGGFQMLCRRSRFGNIGYVSKGPVIESDNPELSELCVTRLLKRVRANRLLALIVQPPDLSTNLAAALNKKGFLLNHLVNVIDATLIVDLGQHSGELERGMSRSMRQNIQQAVRRGVVTREAGESELGLFFRLMSATCERQGVRPNPSSESSLRELWRAFHSAGRARLSLAEVGGEVTAGLLCLLHGKRVTLWKKGWLSRDSHSHCNELLNYDALRWASRNGYEICDFAGMDREMAIRLLSNEPLSEAHMKSRHFFNLRFGSTPALLAPAFVHFPHPALQLMYATAIRFSLGRRLVSGLRHRVVASP